MTPKQFENLKPGDTIRSNWSKEGYVVRDASGPIKTVVRTVTASNPKEWELVIKASLRRKN